MRRTSSNSCSQFPSGNDLLARRREPYRFINNRIGRRLFLPTMGAVACANRINTDRRCDLCGTPREAMAFPVCRAGRARRDYIASRGGRNWWRTPAGLGCSTRARRESSRLKHWAYSWHPFADCSKREGPTISATRQPRWRGGGTERRAVRGFCQNSTTL
jgi:hypothetical protein